MTDQLPAALREARDRIPVWPLSIRADRARCMAAALRWALLECRGTDWAEKWGEALAALEQESEGTTT